jgi:hypothetical protein
MDLAAWAFVSSFTVDQAACLWAGADPAKSSVARTDEERTRIAARKQMLVRHNDQRIACINRAQFFEDHRES